MSIRLRRILHALLLAGLLTAGATVSLAMDDEYMRGFYDGNDDYMRGFYDGNDDYMRGFHDGNAEYDRAVRDSFREFQRAQDEFIRGTMEAQRRFWNDVPGFIRPLPGQMEAQEEMRRQMLLQQQRMLRNGYIGR